MSVNINKVPFNEIPHEEAFHPIRGPLWQKIFDIINQSRDRIGGDFDFISEVSSEYVEAESTHNYDIRQLQSDRDKYLAEAQTNRKIRSLQAENDALKAQLSTISRSVRTLEARLNSFIAETATNA